MTTLLFPGRHLLHTAFQELVLRRALGVPLAQLTFLPGPTPPASGPIDRVLFAITSSNQQHSRYNPIPFYLRAIGVDRFARALGLTPGGRFWLAGIPHYPPTPRFASIVLEEIAQQTEGAIRLEPGSCVVLSSTADVGAQFQALGFAVLPGEAGETAGWPVGAEARPPLPVDLLRQLAEVSGDWREDAALCRQLAPSTITLWEDFPHIPLRVRRLWRDPLLTDGGGLTESRDYDVYLVRMSSSDIMRLKYADVRPAILPGKIVDEGCADGALLALVAADFPDSDLIGIEIAGELIARCLERQRAGDYGGAFVHFHQRNIAEPIFEDDSIDTTLCNSTLHELWSYGAGEKTVRAYLVHKFAQTRPGGRLVIRDVVGPESGERLIWLWLNHEDGDDRDVFASFPDRESLAGHLAHLSTLGRFRRFARDFLAARRGAARPPFRYRLETRAQRHYAVLRLRDAAEFISKMAYVENWESEMNEEFAFWAFSDWKAALRGAGFRLLESSEDATLSRAYLNPWLVENRYAGRVAFFHEGADGDLILLPYPVSNVVLVAEKPRPNA